jgi:hypothetical protein
MRSEPCRTLAVIRFVLVGVWDFRTGRQLHLEDRTYAERRLGLCISTICPALARLVALQAPSRFWRLNSGVVWVAYMNWRLRKATVARPVKRPCGDHSHN